MGFYDRRRTSKKVIESILERMREIESVKAPIWFMASTS